MAQSTPQPQSTPNGKPLSWSKVSTLEYKLWDAEGESITKKKQLSSLRTDTLVFLDRNARNIYLLPDAEDAANNDTGKMTVLARDIGSDFYITNKYSFNTYIDDVSYSGKFVNISGNYIYYLAEFDRTFFHDGIRSFDNWGAKTITELPVSPENTYWFRNAEKQSYGLIQKGVIMDYSNITSESEDDDLIIKLNGQKKYRLPGYYTVASFIIKPVELYTNEDSNAASGCVSGNCNDGWGTWKYEGGYYEGFWLNGTRQGYGMYVWDDVGKYIGNWDNDTMNGYGVYLANNDDNIVGEYRNGKLNGYGYKVINDKWEYGKYTDGDRTTAFDYYRNNVEVGCTSGDCVDKYGYYVWENGDRFAGFFKNGKRYLGTYTFADGNKYSGMFNEAGQYHGTGRFFFSDGSYYGGEWKNGKYEGVGYFHDAEKKRRMGEWSEGVLVKSYQ